MAQRDQFGRFVRAGQDAGSTTIELTPGAEAVLKDLQALPKTMLTAIARAMDLENQYTISHIVEDYMSFPKDGPSVELGLRADTGRLRQSVRASEATISGDQVSSAIGSNVKYAAIHEFGGTIPAHTVTAKGKALRFQIGDRVLFRKSVNIPEVDMPARSPIQRGIRDRLDAYGESISAAIQDSWEKGSTA